MFKTQQKLHYFFPAILFSQKVKVFILIYYLTRLFSTEAAARKISDKDSVSYEEFTIGLEFRPRTEFRNGYRELRNDTTSPAFFTDQRSRLNITYLRQGFIFHTSVQDIRIWGEDDPRSTGGTLQVFEAYVETDLSKDVSLRIGRQKIMYDNERLFARNNWRQNGGAHDAARFIYTNHRISSELIGAYNQNQERFSGTIFNPEFKNYKVLLAHFLLYPLTDKLSLTSINAMDGYQRPDSRATTSRFTSGGRATYIHKRLVLTLAAYYQYGRTPNNQKLQAYYYQPEIQYSASAPLRFRLGAEVFSGDNGKRNSDISRSFDALYGVNHRFLGSMDFFTRFPADFNHAGIIAPYFFVFHDLGEKLTIRADEHVFFTQNHFVHNGQVIHPYLGFENDLLLLYRPGKATEIQLGFSYALVTKSMTYIKESGNHKLFHTWAFMMITFQPELFSFRRGSLPVIKSS